VSLNPAQEQGVSHRGSSLLVLAGAGTGKTRVITHRVASLLAEGVPPWQILAVTFTNKAAGEMRERIASLCENDPELAGIDSSRMWVGTFHAISARILRRHGEAVGLSPRFAIYDTADQRSLMKTVLKSLDLDPKQFTPAAVLGDIDRAKNRGLDWQRHNLETIGLYEPRLDVVHKAWRAYEERLRAADAADFGDLLTLCVRLLKNASVEGEGGQLAGFDPVARLRQRFSHVVVDEFQDTNPVQSSLVELLSTQAELCVVGDDDQSIYGWRGADVSQILDFPQTHAPCEVIRLEQNYRSTGHILSCADAIIRHNSGRLGKTLWSDLGEGEMVRVACLEDERAEARWVASQIAHAAMEEGASLDDFAIFYRTHAQSRAIEEAFRRADLPYKMVGGTRFFDRAEIKDLIAYLRLLLNPASEMDFVRIVNRPARGIGAKTVSRLQIEVGKSGEAIIEVARDPKKAGVGSAAARKVQGFVAIYDELVASMSGLSIDELAELVLEKSGYRERLSVEGTDEATSRLENIQEFLGALSEFVREEPNSTLADYLEQVSLATSEDEGEGYREAVTMMTVHSAKGLEFERVFAVGMEEGVFPHARSLDDPEQMEEERRLAYVAVTRAKRELSLTLATRRWLFGQAQVNAPSRFVGDLPPERVEEIGVRRPRGRLHFGATGLAAPEAPADPSWDDDIVLDEPAAAASGDGVPLYVGMPLRHAKFGVGDLVGWTGMGAQLKLVVRFPTVGQKTILARFCQPA
jgi:DNA helicase-2/ATP-dependent DNA helicase PcrA